MIREQQKQSVSIIVPLYRGKRFVRSLLKQVEKNAFHLKAAETQLQLILYNDLPDETIDVTNVSTGFEIEVVNAEKNRGIHGARVAALERAKGEYVLFLDQDDIIDEYYLMSQLSRIGNADAVVCRLVNGDKLHYTKYFRFEEVITKEFMVNHWCPIVSPGQVLIRKASIPCVWKANILENNGADDYFLWLCMAAAGKQFALNQDVLFHHVINGTNTSLNTNMMMDSEHEVIDILKREHVFSGKDQQGLEGLLDSLRRVHINELNNYRDSYAVYDCWLDSVLSGKNPLEFFGKKKVKSLAIYGAGEIGKSFFKVLKAAGFQGDVFFIDRNAEYIKADIPIYQLEEAPQKVDAAIIAINKEVESVMKKLEEMLQCPVYQIKDFLEGENETGKRTNQRNCTNI